MVGLWRGSPLYCGIKEPLLFSFSWLVVICVLQGCPHKTCHILMCIDKYNTTQKHSFWLPNKHKKQLFFLVFFVGDCCKETHRSLNPGILKIT